MTRAAGDSLAPPWHPVRDALDRAAQSGVFSGASLEVRRGDAVLAQITVGRTRADAGGAPVDADTIFDLASLTKIIVTTSIVMRAFERGELRLDDPVGSFIPPAAPATRDLTLGRLLAHTSGLPAWRAYHEALHELAIARRFDEGRARLFDAALHEGLEAPPGSRHTYSDVGFLVLGAVLEAQAGERLDRIFAREVAQPLSLRDTFYVDLAAPEPARAGRTFAATEACPWRGRVLSGEVHDDNAFCAGGVLPHAGLFGTARDVAAFGSELLRVGAGASSWLSRETLATFATRDPDHVGGAHAFGFDVSTPPASQAGGHFGGAIGHLGFTGTSLWIDRAKGIVVALLTNRVHPSRDDGRIRVVRPAIHDAIAEALEPT
jgi:CubicO group peptidase (beta-lactamase class C family)